MFTLSWTKKRETIPFFCLNTEPCFRTTSSERKYAAKWRTKTRCFWTKSWQAPKKAFGSTCGKSSQRRVSWSDAEASCRRITTWTKFCPLSSSAFATGAVRAPRRERCVTARFWWNSKGFIRLWRLGIKLDFFIHFFGLLLFFLSFWWFIFSYVGVSLLITPHYF